MHSSRAARAGRRPLAGLALISALLLGLAACGDGDTTAQPVDGAAGPAGVSTSETSDGGEATPSASASTTDPDSDEEPTSGDEGCPQGGDEAPEGAGAAIVGDLDGDGAKDEIWLADKGNQRLLGVRTATGASFSTTFESASPQTAKAVANRLGDGSAIILLSTGRSAALYAVVDCKIVPTENVDGEQYTFDLNFGGYGTGVACPMVKDKLYLAGYQTEDTERADYGLITRTRIDLSKKGIRADNGTVAELGDYANDSATYKIAHGVSCGDSETAEEPQS